MKISDEVIGAVIVTSIATACVVATLTIGASGIAGATENEPPLADAGLDQTVDEGDVVLLDGTGSRDPDGEIVTYAWTVEAPDGETVPVENASDPTTQFRVDQPGRYDVTLAVTDDDGAMRTDTLYVTVEPNEPPTVAIEGPDEVSVGETATYTADASDPDGRVVAIEWENGDDGAETTRTFTSLPGSTVTLTVEVTDDLGATAVATKDVDVVAPEPEPEPEPDADAGEPDRSGGGGSGTAMRPPTLAVDGPSTILQGTVGDYSADVTSPDTTIERVLWTAPREVHEGLSWAREFGGQPGSTVTIGAVAQDDAGQTAQDSIPVRIVAPPNARIAGVPEECVLAGSTHTLEAIASDPHGEVVDYTWEVDGEVVGHAPELTHTFEQTGDVPVALTVTDDGGRSTTVTETVCTTTDHSPPEITSIDATFQVGFQNSPGAPPVEHDAFATTVDAEFPLVEFDATARDHGSDDLTFHWEFGDGSNAITSSNAPGDSHESSVSHDYSTAAPETQDTRAYEVTLTVEDEYGAQTTATETLAVAHRHAGVDHYELSADRTTVEVGEPVTFTIENTGPGRYVEGDIYFGDGMRRYQNEHSSVHQYTRAYEKPGTYTVQFRHGNEQTGLAGVDGQLTIEVVDNEYTEYRYGVEEQRTQIATSDPGSDWTQGDLDHHSREQVDTKEETVRAHSSDARHLEAEGYTAEDSWTDTEQVGTRYQRSTNSPGSDWTLDERNVDTIERQTGWEYRTFDSYQYGSEWSLVREVRTTEEITQTTTSADRPAGSGWSVVGSAGQERTGWDYGWVSSRFQIPANGEIIDTREILVDESRETVCVDWQYYRTWSGDLERRCIDTEVRVDRTYTTEYRYRAPEYTTIWEWERTVTIHDTDYEYRRPVYEEISRHQYAKPIYEDRTYVEYQKPVYEMIPYYEWHRTVTIERVSLNYPYDIENVVWVEEQTYSCSEGGVLVDQYC